MFDASQMPELQTKTFHFSGYGEVYTYTVLQEPPEGFEEFSPYIVALVKLDEGPLVLAQLTDVVGNVEIGQRVEMVTRKLTTEGEKGMIVYGYKFRPLIV